MINKILRKNLSQYEILWISIVSLVYSNCGSQNSVTGGKPSPGNYATRKLFKDPVKYILFLFIDKLLIPL